MKGNSDSEKRASVVKFPFRRMELLTIEKIW